MLRGAAVGMGWEAALAVVPLLAQRAIDQGMAPRDWRQLSLWLAALLLTGLLTAIFSGMRHIAATQAGAFSDLRLRARLVRHLLSLDAGFHDQADRGDVLTRVSTDVRTISLFTDLIATWIAHLVGVSLSVFFMLHMDLGLGLIGTAFIPIVLLLSAAVMRAHQTRTAALREAAGRLTGILHENIFGVRVIRGFGAESCQRNRFTPASASIVERAMSLVRLDTVYALLGGTLPALAMVGVLWRGGRWAITGEVTVGMLPRLPPRLYDPEEGDVYLDGFDLRALCLEELRKAVCLAADDAMLFRDTMAANIALGMPQASDAQIERAARLAQAHRFVTEMPDGYESVIGERGLTLSGGQRVAPARAVLVGSRVLRLDDASSSLDPATDGAVWKGLTGSEQKRTLLAATRRRRVAARADRMVLLDAGRIVAEGSDEE